MKSPILLFALFATGCADYARHSREYDQKIAREKAAALMQRCSGYGFKPGTPDFSRCLMAADNNQRAIDAADNDRSHQQTQKFIRCSGQGGIPGC